MSVSQSDFIRRDNRKGTIDLSIIVVSWNTLALLKDCLSSIEIGAAGISHEVIVVDNGSIDGSPEMVANEFPSFRLVCNEINHGFARAANQGIRESLGSFIVLLNSDTMVSSESLKEMLRYIKQHPDVGAVGCQLLWANGKRQYSGGYRPSVWTSTSQALLLPNISGGKIPGVYISGRRRERERQKPISVDWACAACVMVRREMVEEIGLLNEDYFMYAEDIEWGLRMRDAGWEVKILPGQEVIHFGGGSSTEPSFCRTSWLEGLYRVANERKKTRLGYMAFGLMMSLTFMLRTFFYFVSKIFLQIIRKNSQQMSMRASSQRHYAGLSFRLAIRSPKEMKS